MKKKYLLIDDEGISINDTLFYINYYLKESDVIVKRNCGDAIETLEKDTFDLIILDIQLPPGDYDFGKERGDLRYGLDVLEIVRTKYPRQPILCFTVQPRETLGDIFNNYVVHICKTADNAFIDLVDTIKSFK